MKLFKQHANVITFFVSQGRALMGLWAYDGDMVWVWAYDGGGSVAIDVAPFSIISPCPIATMQRPFAKIVCRSHVPPFLMYVYIYIQVLVY